MSCEELPSIPGFVRLTCVKTGKPCYVEAVKITSVIPKTAMEFPRIPGEVHLEIGDWTEVHFSEMVLRVSELPSVIAASIAEADKVPWIVVAVNMEKKAEGCPQKVPVFVLVEDCDGRQAVYVDDVLDENLIGDRKVDMHDLIVKAKDEPVILERAFLAGPISRWPEKWSDLFPED